MAYLRKVKKGWQVNINYTDPATGKRKRKTKTVRGKKEEAEDVMADMIKKYKNGNIVATNENTLEEWLHIWLEEKRKNVSYKTYQNYESIARAHIIPTIGQLKINEIKPHHITKYIAEKRENGRIGKKGGLSERTLNYHYITLNGALQEAYKLELIEKNPCIAVNTPRQKSEKRDMNVLTFDEVNYLLDKLSGEWIYPVVYLDINTGMRRGEICGLKWEDFNQFSQMLSVIRSIVRVKGEGLVEKTTKRKSSNRAIDISDDVSEFLKEQLKKQKKIKKFSEGYNPDNRVFTMPDGRTIDPDYITETYSKIISELDIKHHTFHDLRHTHASLLLQSGAKMKIIQERLGHASITTTMDTYAHLLPGMQKEAVSLLERNLKRVK